MVLSARMTLVLVAFQIAFLVLPFSPEIRAMQRAIWSPCRFLTSLIWKVQKNKSSSLNKAIASSRLKPSMKALRKSQVLWIADRSTVQSHSLMSTVFFLGFILICNFMFCTTVQQIFSQLFLSGVILLGGMITECFSKFCCLFWLVLAVEVGSMSFQASMLLMNYNKFIHFINQLLIRYNFREWINIFCLSINKQQERFSCFEMMIKQIK